VNEFIAKKINPPGITKKNRFAVFSTIGGIADIVRSDALKAFNAHFPYLADMNKLKEHAKALSIPHIEDDTEEAFRGRVTAASFYLMRKGERGYIHQQLLDRFNDRYQALENFLRIKIRVLDLDDAGKKWVKDFFDTVLDPNIALELAAWVKLSDKITPADAARLTMKTGFSEHLVSLDAVSTRLSNTFADKFARRLCLDGTWLLDGTELLNGLNSKTAVEKMGCVIKNAAPALSDNFTPREEKFSAAMKKYYFLDGGWNLDGKVYLSGGKIIPLE
jgi:hypothetical protein